MAAAGRLPGAWVLWAPLLGGLALLGVGPAPARALHNVTAELFGTEAWGTLAAFGDLNSDKQTDLFVLRERNDLIVFLADQNAPYFKPKVKVSLKNHSALITGVVPGDYDGDSQMDVLLTYLPKNHASSELGAVIFWGQNQTLDPRNRTVLSRTFQDEPLIMDFNGDLIPDVFGVTNGSGQPQILLGGNLSWHPALTTKRKMRIPHSNAFIDLTEDFTADLFLTTLSASGTSQFEIWKNVDGNFSLGAELQPPQALAVVGQSAFADFDGDGHTDHLLPGCEDQSCQKSAIYLARSGTPQWVPVLQDFSNKGTLWGFVPPEQEPRPMEIPIPITLHIGDYNMDGYPDALAVLKNTSGSNQQAFLLENVPCTNASCEGARRMFRVYWELTDLSQVRDAMVATFFDIYEDGILDILVLSKGYARNDFAIHALKNNFEADAYFVKVIVLSGLCSNDCPRKITPFGVNQPGPYIMYTTVDANGYLKKGSVLLVTVLVVEGIAVAQKTQDGQTVGIRHIPATQCGVWVRTSNGGHFASPSYPDAYPPNKECVYVLEAAPRQRIELTFDEHFYIEPSFECRFDHLEVRDGPFGFSPLIDRFCGVRSPPLIRSTGRFMWVKFSSDEELEGMGFRAKYSFIPDPDFTYLGGILNPIPDCQFELSGADGVVRSSQVEQEGKTKPGQAVDCIWTVRATPKAKIYLRFLDYQMEHSNECKRNFVAVYDGSSSIENLKAKFCSTVANDVTLKTGVGVIRMWADEGSRLSRFRMLFTSFVEPPCTGSTFFCHSSMCINSSLVCNGVQNCAYPWDESHCREKKQAGLFEQITRTHGTIIGVTSGVVLVLLIVSILVQVKQPRKKVLACKSTFNKPGFQEVFDPPHYELFSLRDKELAADLADLAEELDGYHQLRRTSSASRCVHDHHCGAQAPGAGGGGGGRASRTNLAAVELPFRNDFAQPQPMQTFNSTFKKSSYSFKQAHECPEQALEDRVMEDVSCEIYVRGREDAAQASISIDF